MWISKIYGDNIIKRVFLGGTCANINWRSELAPILDNLKIDNFDQVIKDWNILNMYYVKNIKEVEENYKTKGEVLRLLLFI